MFLCLLSIHPIHPCSQEFIFQECGGNPKATAAHTSLNEAAGCLRDVAQDLVATMEEAASAAGAVSAMIDNLGKAIAKVGHSLGILLCVSDLCGIAGGLVCSSNSKAR